MRMTTSSIDIPNVPLRGGIEIPQLGFGVFQIPPEDTEETVLRALRAGYRHIDTAAAYRNEAAVGRAIRASGLAREDMSSHGERSTRASSASSSTVSTCT
jgi:2,5-diketo-D-gluconate reductase A